MDIWRLGIVERSQAEILQQGFGGAKVTWVADEDRFSFLADPFGVMHDDRLVVFAEAYNYRQRLGRIDALTFAPDLTLERREVVLSEPWHLSYPVVIEDAGERWMIPEAHRSGRLMIYRAAEFPQRWEVAGRVDLPLCPVDATPLWFDGRWWLFFAAGNALHLAIADRLLGPWQMHPASPLLSDPRGSRPGGTAAIIDGQVVLPVQDCAHTYGGNIRPLRFDLLTSDAAVHRLGSPLSFPAESGPFSAGLHTLSACGPRTLIDMKRFERSPSRLPINVVGRMRRAARGWSGRLHRSSRH